LPHVRSIKCGADFVLSVATESKQVYAWGKNKYGQINPDKTSTMATITPSIIKNY
jgi:alpha-tubulin suppressor-like RCC1 family protein